MVSSSDWSGISISLMAFDDMVVTSMQVWKLIHAAGAFVFHFWSWATGTTFNNIKYLIAFMTKPVGRYCHITLLIS
jgi:hypothetical protein